MWFGLFRKGTRRSRGATDACQSRFGNAGSAAAILPIPIGVVILIMVVAKIIVAASSGSDSTTPSSSTYSYVAPPAVSSTLVTPAPAAELGVSDTDSAAYQVEAFMDNLYDFSMALETFDTFASTAQKEIDAAHRAQTSSARATQFRLAAGDFSLAIDELTRAVACYEEIEDEATSIGLRSSAGFSSALHAMLSYYKDLRRFPTHEASSNPSQAQAKAHRAEFKRDHAAAWREIKRATVAWVKEFEALAKRTGAQAPDW